MPSVVGARRFTAAFPPDGASTRAPCLAATTSALRVCQKIVTRTDTGFPTRATSESRESSAGGAGRSARGRRRPRRRPSRRPASTPDGASSSARAPAAARAAPWRLSLPSSASTSARPASRRSPSRRTGPCSRARRAATRSRRRGPGWSEQDPEDWWAGASAALAEVSAGRSVAGIGLSGQMHGLVVLDAEGRVIRPALLWNDQRTAAECVEIEERVGPERLIELTGNRALTGFTAPKLLWLRRHEPDAYARIARVMLPKDYVRLRLTGEWAIDAADASGTLLFDVARTSLERRGAGRARAPARLVPARARVAGAGRRRHGRRRAGRPGRGGRGRPACGGARGRDRPAGAGVRRPRHVRRRARRAARATRTIRRAASTPSATPCPERGRRWG